MQNVFLVCLFVCFQFLQQPLPPLDLKPYIVQCCHPVFKQMHYTLGVLPFKTHPKEQDTSHNKINLKMCGHVPQHCVAGDVPQHLPFFTFAHLPISQVICHASVIGLSQLYAQLAHSFTEIVFRSLETYKPPAFKAEKQILKTRWNFAYKNSFLPPLCLQVTPP